MVNLYFFESLKPLGREKLKYLDHGAFYAEDYGRILGGYMLQRLEEKTNSKFFATSNSLSFSGVSCTIRKKGIFPTKIFGYNSEFRYIRYINPSFKGTIDDILIEIYNECGYRLRKVNEVGIKEVYPPQILEEVKKSRFRSHPQSIVSCLFRLFQDFLEFQKSQKPN